MTNEISEVSSTPLLPGHVDGGEKMLIEKTFPTLNNYGTAGRG